MVVAFVLDMYGSSERLDAERLKTMELIEKEMSGQLEKKETQKMHEYKKIKEEMNRPAVPEDAKLAKLT